MSNKHKATPADLERFTLPGLLHFEIDEHGLLRALITTAHCNAAFYLHGAHITHWLPSGEEEVLFLSRKAHFKAGQPIRGGIPIVFPWFNAKVGDPAAPHHGWARINDWQVEDSRQINGDVEIILKLESKDIPSAEHPCTLRYRIRAGLTLRLDLKITNEGPTLFRFEEALHTYFAVGDIHGAIIHGLEGVPFSTILPDRGGEAGSNAPVNFESETDYVYQESGPAVTIEDGAAGRRIIIEKSNSASTVVWNPWIEKAAAMSDFGDDEWPSMLCVETANIRENAIQLAPGQTHSMTAILKIDH